MTDAKTKRTEPLPLERYATLAAELDVTQELSPILEREKVEKELWLATQAHWLKRMADEAHRKALIRLIRKTVSGLRFPSKKAASQVTLPLVFER